MLSKIKGKFSQQPLKFDDLESILPIDQQVDFEDNDDVDAKDLFISGGRKNSFTSKLLASPSNLFASASSTPTSGMGPKKNSFNRLFMDSPTNAENVHPNANYGTDKLNFSKAQSKPLGSQSMDVFKMKSLSESLPTSQGNSTSSPTHDARFASTRPTRDSPTAASSSARAPNIFRDEIFQPQPTITRHSQVWNSSQQYKQEAEEEKQDYYANEGHYNDEFNESVEVDNHFEVDIETLFSKVRHNHSEYVAQALSNGVDPNVTDANGNTMLHVCAQNNNKKIATLLLTSYNISCDVNIINRKSHTALDYAVKYGHQKLAQYFESKGGKSGLNSEQNKIPSVVSNPSFTRYR